MRIKNSAKKFIAKILVAVLIISMMPAIGVEVHAAIGDSIHIAGTTLTIDGNETVTVTGMNTCFITDNGTGVSTIRNDIIFTGISDIVLSNGGSLEWALTSANFNSVYVYYGSTLKCTLASLTCSKIYNYGTIESGMISLTNSNLKGLDNNTVWKVSGTFSISGFSSELLGTVIANEDTVIESGGGSFTLRVSGYPDKLINSPNRGTAKQLLLAGTLATTGLKFSATGVNVVDGVCYAKDSYTLSPPAGYKWGTYGTYLDSFTTDSVTVYENYDVNPTPSINPSNSISLMNSSGASTLPQSFALFLDEGISDSDGDSYIVEFDPDSPTVLNEVEIKKGTDTSSVEFSEGMTIEADSATIIIDDRYLYTVTVSDGTTYTRGDSTYPVTDYSDFWRAEIKLNAVSGVTSEYTITAKDCSLNTTTFTVKISGGFISADGLKCTLSGLVNEKYTKDKVTVKAPDGYEIMPSYGSGDKYVESVDYKKSDLYGSDGKFKSDLTFTFKRKSDGAVTKPVAWDKCCDFLDDVIFDEIDPAISTVTADNKTINFKTGDVIEAASVSFTVTDINLEKIVVDKTTTDRTNGVKKDGNLYKGTVTFKVAEGESKSYKFTAYDMAGRAVEYTFTLKYPRQVPALTVALADQFAGVTYAPTITTVSDGAKDVKYYYAESVKASVSDNTFSETVPTMPGKYVVKAVIPETNKYLAATAYAEFSIAYLPAPENPYTLEGETGDNDYYTSDVIITPPTGYTICTSLTGTYTKTLTYSAALTNIYLKQTSTGALTGPIAFNETLKVDKTAPALSTAAKNQAGNVVDLSKLIYADKVTFTISDEHLSKVTINGEEVSFTDGKVTVSLICNGHKYFNIVAVDEAGNEYSFRVEMKATWLQSGIVPVGILISLVPGEGVALEPGEFIIEDSDDTTVYNGGMEVYVSEETELTLIKVN